MWDSVSRVAPTSTYDQPMPAPQTTRELRPAARINAEIRALVRATKGRRWTQAERALYGLLLEEWAAAVEKETAAAA